MDTQSWLFLVFSACTLLAGLRVITARNPVHAVLFLVLSFFSAACLWMQLQAEFLAIVLILVYVGAVMVLFLFVVMMLDINIDRTRTGFWRQLPAALLVGIAIALQLWLVLSHGSWQALAQGPVTRGGNTAALGRLAFTEYLLPRTTNIRRVFVQDDGPRTVLWVGSNHGASIVKVEPQD